MNFVSVSLLLLGAVCGSTRAAAAGLDLRTSLCIAVDEGDVEEVKALLADYADVNEACTFLKSDYPLHIAARKGDVEIGQMLLSSRADVNQAGFLGYTPLLRAGEGLHPNFTQLLLDHSADVNTKLVELPGLNLNLGLDMLSLTTASYLRKSVVASSAEQQALDGNYASILDQLAEHCFDFRKFGRISETRLRSERHPTEASLVARLEQDQGPSC